MRIVEGLQGAPALEVAVDEYMLTDKLFIPLFMKAVT